MELRQLRYFVIVAEELNFNRAAEHLLVAQPALSQQIRHLEEELGVSLFDRSRRQIQLTAAGSTLLTEARKLLAELDKAIRISQRAGRGELGRLIIGCTPIASWLLPDIMRVYQEHFPEVKVMVEELLSFEQVHALQQLQIDVAITLGAPEDANLSRKLISSLPSLIAFPTHPTSTIRTSPFILWKELAAYPFIMFPRRIQTQLFDQFVSRCQSAGYSPTIVKEVAQIETILNLVSAGIGIAPVPAYLQEMVQWKGMAFQALEEPAPKFEIFVLWRSNDSSPTLQNFLQVL